MGNSNIESGSYFFRKAINFNDEYDPDIYFGRFDVFYPYADWLVDIRTQKNKCVISNDEIAEEEFAQLQIAVQTEQYTVLANCD